MLFSSATRERLLANAHMCSLALSRGGRVLARSKPAAAPNYATAKLLLALCLGRLTWAPFGPCPKSVRVYKRRLIEVKVGSRFLSSKEINPADDMSTSCLSLPSIRFESARHFNCFTRENTEDLCAH